MPLRNQNKSSNDPSLAAEKSRSSGKKKRVNGDSLRNELHGLIPDLSSSDGQKNGENGSLDSTSSSIPSSDDESGVFDTRFDLQGEKVRLGEFLFFCYRTFHPVEHSDDLVVFDHQDNNADVSVLYHFSIDSF